MRTGIFWQSVYWLSLPVLAVLAVRLYLRRFVGRFPFFFCYVLSGVGADVARLLTYRAQRSTYFNVFWVSDSVSTAFALLATCELVLRLFPGFQRVAVYRYLFGLAAAVIAGCALLVAKTDTVPLLLPILITTLHMIDFLRVAMLLFAVGLMLFMGRRWDRNELGIALGLTISAAAFLNSFGIWMRHSLASAIQALPIFAYDLACLIWLITFLLPEQRTATKTSPVNPEVLEKARKWEGALKESATGRKSS